MVRPVRFLRHLSNAHLSRCPVHPYIRVSVRERFMRATLNKRQADVVTPRALERRELHEVSDEGFVNELLAGGPHPACQLLSPIVTPPSPFINKNIRGQAKS